MSFFKRLLDLCSRTPQEPTDYVHPHLGFALRIPAGWTRTSLVSGFRVTGGCIALVLPGKAAFNISCGPPDPRTPTDKIARAEQACAFLKSVPRACAAPLRDVATALSEETNVARAEISTVDGFHGLISIIHNNIEYTLQYHATQQARHQIEALIASFRLPGAAAPPQAEAVDLSDAIARLDAVGEADREAARQNLLRSGAEAIPAILASINACNQAVMTALCGSLGRAGPQIDALHRRIELLRDIGDSRAIPAVLNALGDSAKCQDISPEAKQLLITSQDALAKLGQPAVQPVIDSLDTRSPSIRLALVEVLARIGGPQAQQALYTMMDDPEAAVRQVARRARETFSFSVAH